MPPESIAAIASCASAFAAAVAAAAAWGSVLLQARRPEIVADLVVRKEFLDLVVVNIGRGVAYNAVFEATEVPSAALAAFRDSSLLRHGLSVFAPGREFRVPLLSLSNEFWGDGRGFETRLTLEVKYKFGMLWRRNRARTFPLTLGAFSDDVRIRASGIATLEWGE